MLLLDIIAVAETEIVKDIIPPIKNEIIFPFIHFFIEDLVCSDPPPETFF